MLGTSPQGDDTPPTRVRPTGVSHPSQHSVVGELPSSSVEPVNPAVGARSQGSSKLAVRVAVSSSGLLNPTASQPVAVRMTDPAPDSASRSVDSPDLTHPALGIPTPQPPPALSGSAGPLQIHSGQQIGQFRIISPLGQGGMGTVWLAQDTLLDRRVALKVLSVTDHEARERFLREARLAAGLNHPHIVTVHHIGLHDGQPYIVSELIAGGSLDTIVSRQGPMPPVRAAELIRQAALALSYAHAAGIVHRDIKPGNMLLTAEGYLKVGDFGLARQMADTNSALTTPGTVVGTPQYLAPELCTGASPQPAADVYALGCTFYYLMSGRRPFEAESVYQVLLMHIQQPLPDISKLVPTVPDSLVAVLRRATAKDPAERHPSAQALADDLLAALRELGQPVNNARTPSSTSPTAVNLATKLTGGIFDASGLEVPSINLRLGDDLIGGQASQLAPSSSESAISGASPHNSLASPQSSLEPLGTPPMTANPTDATLPLHVTQAQQAAVRNLSVLAALVLVAQLAWLVAAVFDFLPGDSPARIGLYPFQWAFFSDGTLLVYISWLAVAAFVAGPITSRWGKVYGRPGSVGAALLTTNLGLGASMAVFGPLPGLLLLTAALVPVGLLLTLQAFYDHGVSLIGTLLMALAAGLLTLTIVNPADGSQPASGLTLGGVALGGLLVGQFTTDIPWWYYLAFSLLPALLVFLPALVAAVYDAPPLQAGRFQIGLALCLLVSMSIWGPSLGLILPMIPLAIIGGVMFVLLG